MGYLLAGHEPCIRIRDEERQAVRGRVLVATDFADLTAWIPPASWAMAVLLCPGDRLNELLAWVERHQADASRIWFFLHPTTPADVLKSWQDAGYPVDQVDVIDRWQRLHRLFGNALNDQVYQDWAPAVPGEAE